MSCANLVSMARVVVRYWARSSACRQLQKRLQRLQWLENLVHVRLGRLSCLQALSILSSDCSVPQKKNKQKQLLTQELPASPQSTDGTARSAGRPCFSLRRFSCAEPSTLHNSCSDMTPLQKKTQKRFIEINKSASVSFQMVSDGFECFQKDQCTASPALPKHHRHAFAAQVGARCSPLERSVQGAWVSRGDSM